MARLKPAVSRHRRYAPSDARSPHIRALQGAIAHPDLGTLGAVVGGETTEIVPVPLSKVGRVIGKGGATIKEIQLRCNTRLKVDHDAGGEFKPVTVTGTPADVAKTLQMIKDIVEGEGNPMAMLPPLPLATGGAVPSVPAAPMMAGVTVSGGGGLPRKVTCPTHVVGRIIGRGGETIRSLQNSSNAHITINQNFPDG
jgi:far upstream element-binding protein